MNSWYHVCLEALTLHTQTKMCWLIHLHTSQGYEMWQTSFANTHTSMSANMSLGDWQVIHATHKDRMWDIINFLLFSRTGNDFCCSYGHPTPLLMLYIISHFLSVKNDYNENSLLYQFPSHKAPSSMQCMKYATLRTIVACRSELKQQILEGFRNLGSLRPMWSAYMMHFAIRSNTTTAVDYG